MLNLNSNVSSQTLFSVSLYLHFQAKCKNILYFSTYFYIEVDVGNESENIWKTRLKHSCSHLTLYLCWNIFIFLHICNFLWDLDSCRADMCLFLRSVVASKCRHLHRFEAISGLNLLHFNSFAISNLPDIKKKY